MRSCSLSPSDLSSTVPGKPPRPERPAHPPKTRGRGTCRMTVHHRMPARVDDRHSRTHTCLILCGGGCGTEYSLYRVLPLAPKNSRSYQTSTTKQLLPEVAILVLAARSLNGSPPRSIERNPNERDERCKRERCKTARELAGEGLKGSGILPGQTGSQPGTVQGLRSNSSGGLGT